MNKNEKIIQVMPQDESYGVVLTNQGNLYNYTLTKNLTTGRITIISLYAEVELDV